MGNELKNKVDSIVKFIGRLYSPEDVWVKEYDNPNQYSIIFYFDEIDDKYISNDSAFDLKAHKENNLNREIRTYIKNFLGIKTSGLQPPNFYAPTEKHPITTYVKYTT